MIIACFILPAQKKNQTLRQPEERAMEEGKRRREERNTQEEENAARSGQTKVTHFKCIGERDLVVDYWPNNRLIKASQSWQSIHLYISVPCEVRIRKNILMSVPLRTFLGKFEVWSPQFGLFSFCVHEVAKRTVERFEFGIRQ